MKRRSAGCVLLSLTLPLLSGCGGLKIAPVSGVVKLDGAPCKNAIVTFQPLDGPGRTSSGTTDENGRFTLLYDGQKPGAVVGKHRVRIASNLDPVSGDADPAAAGKSPRQTPVERIPAEWHENSTREFTVPSGGTDQANFDIDSKGAGTKSNRRDFIQP